MGDFSPVTMSSNAIEGVLGLGREIAPHLQFLDVSPVKSLLYPLEQQALAIQDASGLPIDQVNFLLLFVLSYPLAIIHRQIWNPTLRHLYSAVLGILTVIYMMGNDFYHTLFSALVTYIILCVVRNPFGTKMIWIWSYGYMTLSHVYRLYIDYMGWRVDFTIVQMVFTLKFCALACNLQDGAFPRGELSSVHKRNAIKSPPNPLEYISYLYYWCTILPGPFFEYNDYVAFIDRSMFKATKGYIPSGSYVAFIKVWIKLVVLLGGVFLAFQHHPAFLFHPAKESFVMGMDLFTRWNYIMGTFMLMRCTYYSGWLMSQAAVILSGFGYNGVDEKGNPKWNRVENIDFLTVEFGSSLKDIIGAWNQGTAYFLRVYVYFRVTKPRAKPGQDPKKLKGLSAPQGQLVVFLVSALWHGCYPGYYYFFVFMFFMNLVATWGSKRITPLIPKNKVVSAIYAFICFYLAHSALNYGALSFIALSHAASVTAYNNLYWLGHILGLVAFIVAVVDPIRPSRKPKTQ